MHPTTIFAPATASGRAGVAVMRISGPDASRIFELCTGKEKPKPRHAELREIRNPQTNELIDKALTLWFPAPHSFTGENVAELHIHGGRATLHAITEILRHIPGFRLAEPGEFTRRAFENGKFDLTEAEAIADLVNAETEAQRKQAMRQFQGELGRLYEDWRTRLTRSLAYIEATIDFADEELPKDIDAQQIKTVTDLAADIAAHLNDNRRGERLRDGFHIAILGPPNAGKSSLLNALTQRDAAIVSSIAGTTRDIVEVHLDLGGIPVTIADTAGLRETADVIESEGVRRALAHAEHADLKLLVFDGSIWPKLDETTLQLADANSIAVVNKADLIKKSWTGGPIGSAPPLPISAKTGGGIAELLSRIAGYAEIQASTTPPLTRARHRAALEECNRHLQAAIALQETALRAEEMRLASRSLGRITGRVDVEDLLDVIFRDFCIGK